MAEQFDLSPEKKRILEENAKRRLQLRNEFLKKASDPFKHGSGEGGTVFDPAIQRYASMKVTTVEHFRPSFSNVRFGLLSTLIPILGYTYFLHVNRAKTEASYRNGEVAYKDREFKLV